MNNSYRAVAQMIAQHHGRRLAVRPGCLRLILAAVNCTRTERIGEEANQRWPQPGVSGGSVLSSGMPGTTSSLGSKPPSAATAASS
jgi:hypothetical protein